MCESAEKCRKIDTLRIEYNLVNQQTLKMNKGEKKESTHSSGINQENNNKNNNKITGISLPNTSQ
jgi:hypothetical protein